MTDHISESYRSWNMSRIKSADTKPEILVRKYLFSRGFRFRLNGKISKNYYSSGVLPGKPDIVLAKYRTVIFVHGCFWHHHTKCKRATWPKTNKKYWIPKIENNIARDRNNARALKKLGWDVEIIWECETSGKKLEGVAKKMKSLVVRQN
jgi:DNA mismatch endonuclease (patch repair protein)